MVRCDGRIVEVNPGTDAPRNFVQTHGKDMSDLLHEHAHEMLPLDVGQIYTGGLSKALDIDLGFVPFPHATAAPASGTFTVSRRPCRWDRAIQSIGIGVIGAPMAA